MSAEQVESYLQALEEPKRTTLQELRRTILEIVPEAEEVISYRVPAFVYRARSSPGLRRSRIT
ncbi:MAG: DUF1801 domain-containing protein, partial [Chloroflexota bacterium]